MSAASIPTSTRAAVLEAYDQPVPIRELPLLAPEPGALLVRIDAASICGSDVHFWRGHFAKTFDIELPSVPGHEGVGEIIAFGAGEHIDSVGAPLRVGDRVLWTHAPCGHCHLCTVQREPELCPSLRIGYLRSCAEPPHVLGTFTEHAYVLPGAGRIRVPDAVRSSWASAASCALRTVVHAFDRLGPIDPEHVVVIQGAGPLGLFATALATLRAPASLIVIGAPAARLELAESWGASKTVSVIAHPDPEERREMILEASAGRGADIVIDMAGAPGAFAEGIHMLARDGRYLVVGTTGGEPQPVLGQMITTRGLRIIGSFSGQADAYHKSLQFMERHRDRFDWDQLIGGSYGLDQLTVALEAVESGRETKPLVLPGSGG